MRDATPENPQTTKAAVCATLLISLDKQY